MHFQGPGEVLESDCHCFNSPPSSPNPKCWWALSSTFLLKNKIIPPTHTPATALWVLYASHHKTTFPWLAECKPQLGHREWSVPFLMDCSWGEFKSARIINFRTTLKMPHTMAEWFKRTNFASSSQRILCKWTFQELCRRWHYSITPMPVPDHSLELIL